MSDDWNDVRSEGGPSRRDATRPTIEQIAVSAERQRRMEKWKALFRGICLLAGVGVVAGGGYLGYRMHQRHQDELERQRLERLQAEKDREETRRKQREEAAARLKAEQEKKAQALAEQRRQQETARAEREKARALAARYRTVKDRLRTATIDYFRNADNSDRPGKVDAETSFLCLFPGDADGGVFYQVRIKPGEASVASRLREDQDPEAVAEDRFTELSTTMPYLIMREYVGSNGSGKSYLVYPKKARRSPTTVKVPRPGSVFNPSKADFGPLYDAVKALGTPHMVFNYRISFNARGLPAPIVLPRVYSFDGEVDRAAVETAVKRTLAELARTNAPLVATLPPLEKLLSIGSISFEPVR